MPYNSGMSALTLVLPFALPPAELAPDLGKHLRAPALATLLSKSSTSRRHPRHEGLHVLPHERWLAGALAGADVDAPAWTPLVMRGLGIGAELGTWFLVHPGHIEIGRSHLLMNDLRQLALIDRHSRALFEAALPYVRELGLDLRYGDASTWFLRADEWAGLRTSSPDAAAGIDITFFLPSGPGAAAFRKLQNELQILWHEHPVNQEREAHRQPPVNAIWTWAGGSGSPTPAARLFTDEASAHLAALAQATGGGTANPGRLPGGDAILYADLLSAPAIGADWGGWIAAYEQIDRDWGLPLLAALRDGQLARLDIVRTGRDTLTESSTTRLSLRKFWRRASLDTLLT